jgi:hypothetical protein
MYPALHFVFKDIKRVKLGGMLMINPLVVLDAYERRHLVAHLEASERFEILQKIFTLETHEGLHAWFELKQEFDEVPGFISDLAIAWRCADLSYETQKTSRIEALTSQLRYLLISASINSVAYAVPPLLLSALVNRGGWSLARVIAYIKQINDAAQQTRSIAALLPLLPPGERLEWVQIALQKSSEMGVDHILRYDEARCSVLSWPLRSGLTGHRPSGIRVRAHAPHLPAGSPQASIAAS